MGSGQKDTSERLFSLIARWDTSYIFHHQLRNRKGNSNRELTSELLDTGNFIWLLPSKHNRPFAQLLPGLETHPVTVGQSPAYDFSVSDEQKAVFLVSVSDCSECDSYAGDWPTVTGCPVSKPGNNCANGLLQTAVYMATVSPFVASLVQILRIDFDKRIYYRKRGSASYIVREWLLWVVERERETPVTSSISRWNREWSCIWLPRQRIDPMHMHTRRRVLSLQLLSSARSSWQAKTTNSNSCDRAVAQVKYRSTYPNNPGEWTASTEEISKKGIKLILKTIGNRKGDCAWSCSRWQTQPEKICKLQSTNQ